MTPDKSAALSTQVGGDHYCKLAIQPVEYIVKNNIPFIEGNIIKYATRWRDKGGIKDLEKIKHFVDLLIEFEAEYDSGPEPGPVGPVEMTYNAAGKTVRADSICTTCRWPKTSCSCRPYAPQQP
jgi:hypothetical protein